MLALPPAREVLGRSVLWEEIMLDDTDGTLVSLSDDLQGSDLPDVDEQRESILNQMSYSGIVISPAMAGLALTMQLAAAQTSVAMTCLTAWQRMFLRS